uniref:Type II secretion system protein K n=1 Tax=Candidatus Kentrum sp. LFY TaxID=2126342 RepID=A0A450UWR3_9GAMM|nr:MAG: general secretion pathway protein K [Candidatus Kentron sp. LFY]
MRHERMAGIALISVLLAVALVATISAGLIARQHIEIRRTTNLLHAHKAYQYALGVESWATRLLSRDLLEGQGNRIDHLSEAWARSLPPTEVAGGMLTGRIEDLQARFNLNNLRLENPDDKGAWHGDLACFRELLQQCRLEPHLVWPVVDWIDGGDRDGTSPGGAEDYEYLGLEIPYRTANRPMADPGELILVRGFDYDGYLCLLPFVSALPGRVPINVNTASARVLMARIDGMTETQAEQVTERRKTEPYQSVDGFTEYLKTIGAPVPEGKDRFDEGSIGVASDYYRIVASARTGNTRMDLFTRIERLENGKIRVLSRSRADF